MQSEMRIKVPFAVERYDCCCATCHRVIKEAEGFFVHFDVALESDYFLASDEGTETCKECGHSVPLPRCFLTSKEAVGEADALVADFEQTGQLDWVGVIPLGEADQRISWAYLREPGTFPLIPSFYA